MLLERGEQVELERQPGMACRHDAMRHELALAGPAEMAIEADRRPRFRLIQRDHALVDVRGMRRADRIVARQPVSAAAVARLAADAVRDVEARAAQRRRDGIGMATEAFGGPGGGADAEPVGDRGGARPEQHLVGAAVRPGLAAVSLPGQQLVLAHHRAGRLRTAVAGGAAA